MPALFSPHATPAASPKPLSVSELTEQLRDVVESRFRNVWVQGELSQVKIHPSGHVYLTLKDTDARLDAVIWRSTAATLRYKPDVGTLVLVLGRLTIYPPRGGYQMVIERLEPVGAGAQEAALQALKEKLTAEGLFDSARKRPLPFLPRKVGVITSASGAARRDIEAVIHRRSPQIPIVLYPAQVQGEGSAADVARGLSVLGRTAGVDVIIVGRGGGSAEDLYEFNAESLVRAIAACPVPVISAVGHETDTTLADLVADLRAPTPSAAAEKSVPVRDDLLTHVDTLAGRLDSAVLRSVSRSRERLGHLGARLARGVAFEARHRSVEALHSRLDRAGDRALQQSLARLKGLEQRLVSQHPRERVSRARAALRLAAARLTAVGPRHTLAARNTWQLLSARLHALSPLGSLLRGYSLTRTADGRVVQDAEQVTPGDTLRTELAHGALTSTVVAVHRAPPSIERAADASVETPATPVPDSES